MKNKVLMLGAIALIVSLVSAGAASALTIPFHGVADLGALVVTPDPDFAGFFDESLSFSIINGHHPFLSATLTVGASEVVPSSASIINITDGVYDIFDDIVVAGNNTFTLTASELSALNSYLSSDSTNLLNLTLTGFGDELSFDRIILDGTVSVSPVPAPEPSSVMLVCSGLGALVFLRRRGKRAHCGVATSKSVGWLN
jgi:hypothetical protein